MNIDVPIPLLKKRRTKVIATVGPASSSPEIIARFVELGVSVFRLNLSHGDHEEHRRYFELIRASARAANTHIAVMADLSGPKIRVGRFQAGSIVLRTGDSVTVTTRNVLGGPGLIPSRYACFASDVTIGDRVLLADGVMELRVESIEDTEAQCRVVQGGTLYDHKGINLPGVNVSAAALTEKDRSDALFAQKLGVDFLALSFVRRAEDIEELKLLIANANCDASVIAKIERPEALNDIERILDVSDAIMIARGDLGVELEPEQVPVIQRQLIDKARAKNTPVIVATQMLESMMTNTRPTRAEVADVSFTISGGADAVMMSGETAAGSHPDLAADMMNRIARQTESYLWSHDAFESLQKGHSAEYPIPLNDAMGNATALLSRELLVRMILVVSHTGTSAATVSAARPSAPVVAVSENAAICRKMALLWGVIPVNVGAAEIKDPVSLSRKLMLEMGLGKSGEHILLVRGFHTDPSQNHPSIMVLTV